MMVRSSWRTVAAIGAVVVLAACGTASPSASTAASQQESTAASAVESMTESMAPVATVPDSELNFAGKLVVCIDIPYPPQEYFDDQGNPTGSDVDLAAEIANRLGLEMVVENTVFDFIIEAVNGGKCDIIVSAQNITAERVAQVDMIPYFQAGQSFVVLKGNPDGITEELSLCGKKVAAETGTTEVQYLEGIESYADSGGLKKKCTDAGMAAPEAVQFQKDSDALLALQAKQVVSYFADSPVAGYYTVQQPEAFELAPIPPLDAIIEGISVPKSTAEASKQGLQDGVKTALLSMMSDGTYLEILTKYGLESGAIKADQVVVNQP